MEAVLSLASLTVAKVLQFSGLLSDNRNAVRSRKMEEKALEVYGEETGADLSKLRPHRKNEHLKLLLFFLKRLLSSMVVIDRAS